MAAALRKVFKKRKDDPELLKLLGARKLRDEPVTATLPGPVLLNININNIRTASHPSGELTAGSFTGIPAGRVEAQKGRCPLAQSCMTYRYTWLSRLGLGQGGLHLRAR